MSRKLLLKSAGDDVKFLQEQLNLLPTNFPKVAVDGKFGPRTLALVQEFQRNNALIVDGVVGPLTWGKLLGYKTIYTNGFFILGRDLYDRLGSRVVLRGINKMAVF